MWRGTENTSDKHIFRVGKVICKVLQWVSTGPIAILGIIFTFFADDARLMTRLNTIKECTHSQGYSDKLHQRLDN